MTIGELDRRVLKGFATTPMSARPHPLNQPMIDRMRALAPLVLAIGLHGCSPPPCADTVWEETLWVAQEHDFDYCGTLQQALAGDRNAAHALFEFTDYTDAAASLGHGVTLARLALTVGDTTFASWISKESPQRREELSSLLQAGFAYLPDYDDPRWGDSNFAPMLPETTRVLFTP